MAQRPNTAERTLVNGDILGAQAFGVEDLARSVWDWTSEHTVRMTTSSLALKEPIIASMTVIGRVYGRVQAMVA
jgi:hypothetical protein